ncbi:hypothetical protein DM01DRAFT_1380132 [Hesseltinella vesiculosa]|uniref:GAR domain-containing protein n=1 Tax=Hesseltinella vesiculosa TaxID=101127 RepID=A0A1X2GWJ1_9FUNG|nr:hypothetical protein DM01DRAFT_1380132 [Hesseltinella vesiculosa]
MYQDTLLASLEKKPETPIQPFRPDAYRPIYVHPRSSVSSMTTTSTSSSNDDTPTIAQQEDQRLLIWVQDHLGLYHRLALVGQPSSMDDLANNAHLLLCLVHRFLPTEVPDLVQQLHHSPSQCMASVELLLQRHWDLSSVDALPSFLYHQFASPSSLANLVDRSYSGATALSSPPSPTPIQSAHVSSTSPYSRAPLSADESQGNDNASPAAPRHPPSQPHDNSCDHLFWLDTVHTLQQRIHTHLDRHHPEPLLYGLVDRLLALDRQFLHTPIHPLPHQAAPFDRLSHQLDAMQLSLQSVNKQNKIEPGHHDFYLLDLLTQQTNQLQSAVRRALQLHQQAQAILTAVHQHQLTLHRLSTLISDACHTFSSSAPAPATDLHASLLDLKTDMDLVANIVQELKASAAQLPVSHPLLDLIQYALSKAGQLDWTWHAAMQQYTVYARKGDWQRSLVATTASLQHLIATAAQLELQALQAPLPSSADDDLVLQWKQLCLDVHRSRHPSSDTLGYASLMRQYRQLQPLVSLCECPAASATCLSWLMGGLGQAMDAAKQLDSAMAQTRTALDYRRHVLDLVQLGDQIADDATLLQSLVQADLDHGDDDWAVDALHGLDLKVERAVDLVSVLDKKQEKIPSAASSLAPLVQQVLARARACQAACQSKITDAQQQRRHNHHQQRKTDLADQLAQQLDQVQESLRRLGRLWRMTHVVDQDPSWLSSQLTLARHHHHQYELDLSALQASILDDDLETQSRRLQQSIQQHGDLVQTMTKRQAWEAAWMTMVLWVKQSFDALADGEDDGRDWVQLQQDALAMNNRAQEAWVSLCADRLDDSHWRALQHRHDQLAKAVSLLDRLWQQSHVARMQQWTVDSYMNSLGQLQQTVLSPAIQQCSDGLTAASVLAPVEACTSSRLAALPLPFGQQHEETSLLQSPQLCDKQRVHMVLDGYSPFLSLVLQWLKLWHGWCLRSSWEASWQRHLDCWQQWQLNLNQWLLQHSQCDDQDHEYQDDQMNALVVTIQEADLSQVQEHYDTMQGYYDTLTLAMPGALTTKHDQLVQLQQQVVALVQQVQDHQQEMLLHNQQCLSYCQDVVSLELVLASLRTDMTLARQRFGRVDPLQSSQDRQSQQNCLIDLGQQIHASMDQHVETYHALATLCGVIQQRRPVLLIAQRQRLLDDLWKDVRHDSVLILGPLALQLQQWHSICDEADRATHQLDAVQLPDDQEPSTLVASCLALWSGLHDSHAALASISTKMAHASSQHAATEDDYNRECMEQHVTSIEKRVLALSQNIQVALTGAMGDMRDDVVTRLDLVKSMAFFESHPTSCCELVHTYDDLAKHLQLTLAATKSLCVMQDSFLDDQQDLWVQLQQLVAQEQWVHSSLLDDAVDLGQRGWQVVTIMEGYRQALEGWVTTGDADGNKDVMVWQGKLAALEQGGLSSVMALMDQRISALDELSPATCTVFDQGLVNHTREQVAAWKQLFTLTWTGLLDTLAMVKAAELDRQVMGHWQLINDTIDQACDQAHGALGEEKTMAPPSSSLSNPASLEPADSDEEDAMTTVMLQEQDLVQAQRALDDLDRQVRGKLLIQQHDLVRLFPATVDNDSKDDRRACLWVDRSDVDRAVARWDHVLALQRDHLDHQLHLCQYLEAAAEVCGYVDLLDDLLTKHEPPVQTKLSPLSPPPLPNQQQQQKQALDDQATMTSFETQYKVYHGLLVSSLDRAKEAVAQVQTPTDYHLLEVKKGQLEQRFARQMKKWILQHQRSRKISLPTKISSSSSTSTTSLLNPRRRFSSSTSSSTSSTSPSVLSRRTSTLGLTTNRPNDYVADPHNDLDMAIGRIVNKAPFKIDFHMVPGEVGRYWFGNKLVYCRILKSRMVMVRVGGGWTELSKFLREHAMLVSGGLSASTSNNGHPGVCQEMLLGTVRVTNSTRALGRLSVSSSSGLSNQAGYKDGNKYIAVDQQGYQHEMKMMPHDTVPRRSRQ